LKFGVRDQGLVEVRSKWGSCILRVTFSSGVRRGQIFAPIHWTEQVASDARIGKVVNPEVDAISGEPEFKHTPVTIQPFYTTWQGVLYIREGYDSHIQESLHHCAWWTKVKMVKTNRYELADRQTFHDTQKNLKSFLPFADETFEWLSIEDISSQLSHSIILKDGIVIASLYIAPPDLLPDRDWVASLFKRERLSALHRKALLAGMPMSATNNDGPLVCSCFKVGKNKIIDAIKTQNITHEKQVTACLKAGGNCGSCLPEIRGLIKACQQEVEV
jgi:assimilatory nitrate reductase catalytic subunit